MIEVDPGTRSLVLVRQEALLARHLEEEGLYCLIEEAKDVVLQLKQVLLQIDGLNDTVSGSQGDEAIF